MKKILIVTILIFIAISSIYTVTLAAEQTLNDLETETKIKPPTQIEEITKKADDKVEKYIETYGSKTYGYVALALNTIRTFSIPVCFIGIVVSAIYQYIIGLKRLDLQEKGLHAMVGFITLLVICQLAPLIFAIVVVGWRE